MAGGFVVVVVSILDVGLVAEPLDVPHPVRMQTTVTSTLITMRRMPPRLSTPRPSRRATLRGALISTPHHYDLKSIWVPCQVSFLVTAYAERDNSTNRRQWWSTYLISSR